MVEACDLFSNLSSGISFEAKARTWLRTRRVSLYLESTVPSSSDVKKLLRSAMFTFVRQGSSRKRASWTTGARCRKLSNDLARRHPGCKLLQPLRRTWYLPRAMAMTMTNGVLPTPGHPSSIKPKLRSNGYRWGSKKSHRKGFKLNVVSANWVMLTAPDRPLLLFWAMCRTFASGHPAMGVSWICLNTDQNP